MLQMLLAMTASTATASQSLSDIDMAFTPFPPIEVEAGPPPVNNFLSKTFGDHMVLQRAPAQAILWGFAGVGNTVTVKMDSSPDLNGVTDAQGFWRATLPATAASDKPHEFLIQSSANGTTAKVSEYT